MFISSNVAQSRIQGRAPGGARPRYLLQLLAFFNHFEEKQTVLFEADWLLVMHL